ncbi:MAG TPA: hypothetical protein PL151_17775, partial [Phycisphaerae bacterium]|nr:hypothetical protein [Phycisphaerae bacterium]
KSLTTRTGQDLQAVLNVTQLVLGLIAVVVMLFLATTAVLTRIPSLPFFSFRPTWQVRIWPVGTIDAALIAIAALLSWWRTGNGAIMTGLMWVLVLMSLWSALQIPASVIEEENGISRAVLVDWVSPFVFGTALSLAAFVTIGGLLAHRRRVEAWPDRLDDLLTPPPAWPGFHYSAGILAVTVLVLGCMFIVSPLTPVAAFLAGASILVLAARRWNENFADAGLGLITLGVLSLFMLGTPDIRGSKAEYFAAVFTRALLGLALMTGFWHWLASVWLQQLDGGHAWTTAGRLIHPCRRLGFLLGAIGVLVSCQLAFWPKLPNVYIGDNRLGRWIWSLLANLLLIAVLTGAARRTGKSTLGWLALSAAASTVAFIVIRAEGTFIYSGFLGYWPLLLAVTAGLLAILADKASHSEKWQPFREPLYVLAVLVLPVIAIFGATALASRAIPPWVAPATFGILTVSYSLAAVWPGPRRFYILTFVCAAAAAWQLLP